MSVFRTQLLTFLVSALAWTPAVTAQEDVEKIVQEAIVLARKVPSEKAVEMLSTAIREQPDFAYAYYHRGRENFRLGRIKDSVADFDRFVKLRPEFESRQWERGIAYFYNGDFAQGAKQFELYQTFHNQDVENSTWRYLCLVPLEGVDKAKETMLPIDRDPRTPMMEIFDLYRGKVKPADVLAACELKDAPADARSAAEFYAHLYLGLWYDAAGDQTKAREHIFAAEKRPIDHYMFDVARIHADKLRREMKERE